MKLIRLSNLGNTCYINSVLQCFLYNEFFTNQIKNLDYLKNISHGPSEFINYFFSKKKDFKRFQQSDAHEFLMAFLELLIDETKENKNEESFNVSWTTFLKNNGYSNFLNEYYGQTKNVIHCLNCKNNSIVFEEFNTINLDVPVQKESLIQLFMEYLKKEKCNDPSNLYFCDHCKSNQACEKKIIITKVPKQLIIVLKRYSSTGTKVISEIEIPEVIYIKEGNEVKTYNIKSTVNHYGNLYDGHYTASVKINESWYSIDDNVINEGKDNSNAYILFYSTE